MGEGAFQGFLRSYIEKYSLKSLNDTQMKETFIEYVQVNFPQSEEILAKIDWDTWMYGKGLPPITTNFMNKDIMEANQLAADYISLKGDSSPANYLAFNGFYSNL